MSETALTKISADMECQEVALESLISEKYKG